MRQFFKFITASCLGTFLAIFLLFVFAFSYSSIIMSSEPEIAKKSILKISLNNVIPEKTGNVKSANSFDMEPKSLGLQRIKELIDHAKIDEKIKGILISGNNGGHGQATLLSLREAIKDFKESGKFVYSYGDHMSQSSYYLASVADSLFLNPIGMIDLKGFGRIVPFFKKMFDNIGFEMEVFYAGDFKSATEPFRRTNMSPENRIQTKEFLDDMLLLFQQHIADSRNMSVADIEKCMDEYLGGIAQNALDAKLVDNLIYMNELEDRIRKRLGLKNDKKINFKTLAQYDLSVPKQTSKSKDKIAVLYAEGSIVYGSNEKGEINEKIYRKYINKIKNNDKIKAVVLRVNSGGGSALSSEIIWHELEELKKTGKPLVASFGDYAASGGYYIACGADTIVSQPNSLTGSIGVFAMFPDASVLLKDKLNIFFDTIKTHPMAVGFTPVMDLMPSQKEYLRDHVDDIYELFLNRVAQGRNITVDEVHNVAQGRIWSGAKAQEIGLVDELGDLEEAIQIAADMTGLTDYKVVEYPKIKETKIEKLMNILAQEGANAKIHSLSKTEKQLLNTIRETSDILTTTGPQAKLIFNFEY